MWSRKWGQVVFTLSLLEFWSVLDLGFLSFIGVVEGGGEGYGSCVRVSGPRGRGSEFLLGGGGGGGGLRLNKQRAQNPKARHIPDALHAPNPYPKPYTLKALKALKALKPETLSRIIPKPMSRRQS